MPGRALAAAALAGLVASALFISGCGSDSSGGTAQGRLSVVMVDAPDPSATAVDVTITDVQANVDGQWMSIMPEPRDLNLLALATAEASLGSITLPPGSYTQVRLFLGESPTITDADGTHLLRVPSGDQTGLKVNVDHEVRPGVTTTLLLDFNVEQSVVLTGNGEYLLKPVIRGVVQELTGTISGVVTDFRGRPVKGARVAALLPDGSEANTALTQADGAFKLWALAPGTYTVEATFANKEAEQEGVAVAAGADTAVGALALPQ
ncbi:MAG: DUF4382 domain-containing protein [Armatimonadetes bacterium]|nr:DUF4382 domain-containing protein [Armatimonadota bacterium]